MESVFDGCKENYKKRKGLLQGGSSSYCYNLVSFGLVSIIKLLSWNLVSGKYKNVISTEKKKKKY